MSGSTIGGIAGFVVGSFFGMPQLGMMIGSAIGGYLDPQKIEGPRLKDASVQTSQDGVPIPFGYGLFPCHGNVIWRDRLIEHEEEERQGKGGGAEVTTYTYTRSYAIGICQGPITGLLLIKRNGKIVYDARSPERTLQDYLQGVDGALDLLRRIGRWAEAQRNRFLNKATIYLGTEDQLPDPTIEAVVGAGNVSAFRGLAYMVVRDDDLTETGGAIPQYEFVVTGAAVEAESQLTLGEITHTINLLDSSIRDPDGNAFPETYHSRNTSIEPLPSGGLFFLTDAENVGVGQFYRVGTLSDTLDGGGQSLVANAGDANGDPRMWLLAGTASGWAVGEDYNHGGLKLYRNGTFAADLRPYADSLQSWFYAPAYPEYGGLVGFSGSSVYMLVRQSGSGGVLTYNRIFAWPLEDADGAVVLPDAISAEVSTDSNNTSHASYFHIDRFGRPWTLNTDTGELKGWDASLVLAESYDLSSLDLTGVRAFGVDGHYIAVLRNAFTTQEGTHTVLLFYHVETRALAGSIEMGVWQTGEANHRVCFGPTSLFVQRGTRIYRIEYTPECLGALPAGYQEIPDSPGYALSPSGEVVRVDCNAGTPSLTPQTVVLGTVVADICRRAGLGEDEIDVSQLTDPVHGYRIASEGTAESFIAPLAQAYFFDVAEWDGKVRFVKRGGDPVYTVGPDDFLERDGDPVEIERVQEVELLRRQTVAYIDAVAAYTPTTQKYERRAGTIQAKGEATIELPMVLPSTEAAQIAEKRIKAGWGEPEKLTFALSLRWAHLTPTDVVHVLLPSGDTARTRLMQVEEDGGRLEIEASRDQQAAYIGTVTGVQPLPPNIELPPLTGPTDYVLMDLPALTESDDELGIYVAARGLLGGWSGAVLQVSSDDGATFTTVAELAGGANMGTTVTDLAAWTSEQYPNTQTLIVQLRRAPSSIDYEALLRYGNRAALQLDDGTWEVLQFQTATALGEDRYELSGLIRGRYNTVAGAAATGARFVLLDAAVRFIPTERWMLGQALKVRAVPLGTDPDAAAVSDFTLAGRSLAEWPVHSVSATRDGSDNVTVTWVGRGRIGAETSAYHSRYFDGYRVTFSDGHTVTRAPDQTAYTRASTPPGVTVTVAPLNRITGAGPASAAIPT